MMNRFSGLNRSAMLRGIIMRNKRASGGGGEIGFKITSLTQSIAGSCDFISGGTCLATSTYKAVTTNNAGVVSYTWVVTGATLASGQGTDTISVTTDSGTDDTFTVQCTVDDTATSDVKSAQFMHDRIEVPASYPTSIALFQGETTIIEKAQ